MSGLEKGLTASLTKHVTEADTARAVGSGSLEVLGTPRVLAWCEEATCEALAPVLEAGATSVGTRVRLDHLAASPVGSVVAVVATVKAVDGRMVTFEVVVTDADGRMLAEGEVRRVVVDVDRFLARVGA
ncbi:MULTISPECIES: thioesterase family protein [Mumia]|uniref:thioesterase family protein n=1 Tax=Mumia TaxID=1546255 RepID=UPI001421C91C|nr:MULTISPECIES: hotdog domain-containing protein [unclassified Mumia]QMW67410.1 thioesterase [Mumia sp. ZJ1417]